MKIRAITDNDIPVLGQVYVDSFKAVDPSEDWTQARAAALLDFIFKKQRDLSFLVEEDGSIGGGVLGMVKPWWDGNHLVETELFLAAAFQRRGIGSKLFRHYLRAAVQRYDVTVMESVTFKDLDFPLSWYRKLGFEAKGDWQVMFGNVKDIIRGLA